MKAAIAPSDVRNMLAHGHWWAFDIDAAVITVRASTEWPNEDLHKDFSKAAFEEAATLFQDIEAELFKLQRQIERRMR